MSNASLPATTRVWRRIERTDPKACWPWTGAKSPTGYGHLNVGRRGDGMVYAHRAAWESERGPIPDGMTVDHLCDHRDCCNPAHMALVPQRENNMNGRSAAAVNARKTHCPQGHLYTEENTYRWAKQPEWRSCLTCMRERARSRRQRSKQ